MLWIRGLYCRFLTGAIHVLNAAVESTDGRSHAAARDDAYADHVLRYLYFYAGRARVVLVHQQPLLNGSSLFCVKESRSYQTRLTSLL